MLRICFGALAMSCAPSLLLANSNCSDLSGKWAGRCTVSHGTDPDESYVASLTVVQKGCEEISLEGDDKLAYAWKIGSSNPLQTPDFDGIVDLKWSEQGTVLEMNYDGHFHHTEDGAASKGHILSTSTFARQGDQLISSSVNKATEEGHGAEVFETTEKCVYRPL